MRKKTKGAVITMPVEEFKKLENNIADLSHVAQVQQDVIEEWAKRYRRLEGEYREVKGKWAAACETLFGRK